MAMKTRNPGTRRRIRPPVRTELPEGPVAVVAGHHRSFGATRVLDGIDLTVQHGEFVALLGRSGCGKSTLLRSLAGLDAAPAAEVDVRGRVSVAFQEPRLLPWRDVQENVALALLNSRLRGVRREKARNALDEVGLVEKRKAWPVSLSGGQAQRVSLARALVSEPELLLLDEPFSALDALTRIDMHRLVLQLWRSHRPAVLLVTHDVDEAIALADRVVLMDHGRVEREWRVEEPRARRSPDNPMIARTRTEVLTALGVRTPTTTRTLEESGAA